MMKPTFQFGLKSVFKATTAAAAFLAIGIAAPKLVVLLAVLTIGAGVLGAFAALSLGVVLCGVLFIRLAMRMTGAMPFQPPDV